MDRETTNKIRFVLEETIPPIIRDSSVLRWLFRRHWGRLVDDIEKFRSRAHYATQEEYDAIYSASPRVHEETDNSVACVTRIAADMLPGSVLDVGCGSGGLLQRLIRAHGTDRHSYTGLDFQVDADMRSRIPQVEFIEAMAEDIPLATDSYDTVICTHLLEHILDIRKAVSELRRVAKNRLIIVVPQEREYQFTFNQHLHFFPYRHSFLRQMIPVPADATCELLGRDIYYCEDLTPSSL